MATLSTPSTAKRPQRLKTDSSNSRFEAYNRLQAAAVAFGEKLPIPEIVAVGGQSDGKSSLLEALLGFRFNVREVEMGTRRPLILQMVHDASALEPRCRFQEEDSEEYGSPVVSASTIADIIKSQTEALLMKMKTTVSAKPFVMRAEYAHCPNLTIIDTPGFVLMAKKGEPDNTPDEILSMGILIDGAADPAPEQWERQQWRSKFKAVLETGRVLLWISKSNLPLLVFGFMVELLLKGLCMNFAVLHIQSSVLLSQEKRWPIFCLLMLDVAGVEA